MCRGGNAIGEVQAGAKPGEFGVAERLDLDPASRTTDDGTHRDHDHIQQGMAFGALDGRIVTGRKVGRQAAEGHLLHRGPHLHLLYDPPILPHQTGPQPHQLDAITLTSQPMPVVRHPPF